MTLTSLINSSNPSVSVPTLFPALFPVDYQSITSLVMDPDFNNKTPYRIHTTHKEKKGSDLEDYGHPIYQHQTEEFNEDRGEYISAYGWKLFWDKTGPFKNCNDIHLGNLDVTSIGNLYDAENGLGYIGGMLLNWNGEPFPNIHYWASRTRLNHPSKGKYEIDKTEAIYYYESTLIN